MFAKRIIPCLDVHAGRVVKGVNFLNIKDVGDPVEYAIEYDRQGADELVLLDISATLEDRRTVTEVVRKISDNVFIPLTVGGGIRTVGDFREILKAGADKVGVNTAAVNNPELIREAAQAFGSSCVVLAIDARLSDNTSETGENKYNVYISGGQVDTGIDLVTWARKGAALGAGEILLTSMDADGTKGGFDIGMLRAVCKAVNIPVVASGGGGSLDSFVDVFEQTTVAAALAASIFHFGDYTVGDVKAKLRTRGIPVL